MCLQKCSHHAGQCEEQEKQHIMEMMNDIIRTYLSVVSSAGRRVVVVRNIALEFSSIDAFLEFLSKI